MAEPSFSFNGSPIIVRDHRRVSLHILVLVASKQRMRRLAVQIPVLVLDAARSSPAAHDGRVDLSGEAALTPNGRCATHPSTWGCAAETGPGLRQATDKLLLCATLC